MADRFIARVLNRLKIPTAQGRTWNEARVRAIRHGYEAAKELGVERRVIREWVKAGHLPASQVCAHAPWVIRREDLYSAQVQGGVRGVRETPLRPSRLHRK